MRRLAALSALAFLAATGAAAEPRPRVLELQVGDLNREALVYAPDRNDAPAPVVFAFHGHGGTAKNAAKALNIQKLWPEAVVVYMQGLPTPGPFTDPAGTQNGWQPRPGDQGDRDLKFFDAVWAKIKSDYKVDEKRVYATGHSNGGGFTYLLWAARPDVFAAFAPSAAAGAAARPNLFKPKPVLHVAGLRDTVVPYELQARSMDAVIRINRCEPFGRPWRGVGIVHPSAAGAPFVALIYPGDHKYPDWVTAEIVRFFKDFSKP